MLKNYFLLLVLLLSFLTKAQTWDQTQKLTAPDRDFNSWFGYSIATDDSQLVVGALLERKDSNGENPLSNAGAAYVYERNSEGAWTFEQKIVASDRKEGSVSYGIFVDIHSDILVVGAAGEPLDENGENSLPFAGAAYIYEKNASGIWQEVQKIVASDRAVNDNFGISVAVYDDIIIVGSDINNEDENGENPLYDAGLAYVFERTDSGVWNEIQRIAPTDRSEFQSFAQFMALDGDKLLIAANGDEFDVNGDNQLVSAGSAYIFNRDNNGLFVQTQKITASDRVEEKAFGSTVDIKDDVLVVGASEEDLNQQGAVYVFKNNDDGVWEETQKLIGSDSGSNDFFAIVSLNENYLAVGAISDNEDADGGNPLEQSGSAYLFSKDANGDFEEVEKITANERGTGDSFGIVALSGNQVLVSAFLEDSDENNDNILNDSGSIYVFDGPELSIEDKKREALQLFPNPTSGTVKIVSNIPFEKAEVSLLNILGGLIKNYTYINNSNINFNMNVEPGVYLVKVSFDNSFIQTLKLIKE